MSGVLSWNHTAAWHGRWCVYSSAATLTAGAGGSPPRPGLDAEQMSGIRGKDSGRLSACAFAEVIHCGDADRAGWTCAEESAEMGLGGFGDPNQKQMFSWYLLINGKA